ncbi:hypothetical protein ACIGXM_06860 [Kitasatospora sp. NPDC052896]|uniref:hypothetical protein n=1 Tax=Kitasatospora sp. NPDC052896 TaxID=3364061 RepID=UPI0037CA84D4
MRSAAVPRLSLGDHLISTVLREPLVPGTDLTTVLDPYYYDAEIDPETGKAVRTRFLGAGFPFDPLQMAATVAPGGVVYQGTATGVVRIAAAGRKAPDRRSGESLMASSSGRATLRQCRHLHRKHWPGCQSQCVPSSYNIASW